MDNNNQGQQLQIDLPQDVAEGVYSNFAIISHSSSEFVLDFAAIVPGAPKASVRSRVLMAPEHVKRLLGALQESMSRSSEKSGFPISSHVQYRLSVIQKVRHKCRKTHDEGLFPVVRFSF